LKFFKKNILFFYYKINNFEDKILKEKIEKIDVFLSELEGNNYNDIELKNKMNLLKEDLKKYIKDLKNDFKKMKIERESLMLKNRNLEIKKKKSIDSEERMKNDFNYGYKMEEMYHIKWNQINKIIPFNHKFNSNLFGKYVFYDERDDNFLNQFKEEVLRDILLNFYILKMTNTWREVVWLRKSIYIEDIKDVKYKILKERSKYVDFHEKIEDVNLIIDDETESEIEEVD